MLIYLIIRFIFHTGLMTFMIGRYLSRMVLIGERVYFIGCPIPGYYGEKCSIPCPDVNCKYCHIETGACQGCKPGYQGHQCQLGMAVLT
jgi:hypothetical protein